MSAVIENTIEIARTPEVVFDYLADQGNEVHWNPDCVSMQKLTDGPLGVGTRFRAKWKQGPVIESTCTLFERPRTWRYGNGGPISVVLTVTLEASPSGGTSDAAVSVAAAPGAGAAAGWSPTGSGKNRHPAAVDAGRPPYPVEHPA